MRDASWNQQIARRLLSEQASPAVPVFHDPGQRRAWWTTGVASGWLLTAIALLVVALATVLSIPPLASETLRPGPVMQATASDPDPTRLLEQLGCDSGATLNSCATHANEALKPALDALPRDTFKTYAFLPVWPETNLFSLEENIDRIDVLMPELYTLELGGAGFTDIGADAPHLETVESLLDKRHGRTQLMPILRLWTGAGIDRLSDPDLNIIATGIADKLSTAIVAAGNMGLCIDVADPNRRAANLALSLVHKLQAQPDWAGKSTCLIISETALWAWPQERSATFDTIVLRPDDRVRDAAYPGPLAPIGEAQVLATVLSTRSDLDKFVIALGTQSAEWSSASAQPKMLSYVDAMSATGWSSGKLTYAQVPANSYSEFTDDSGNVHTLWVQDAASAYSWVQSLSAAGISRFAVWPIGGEDPGIWSLLTKDRHGFDRLVHPDIKRYISYHGEGPLIDYGRDAERGLRVFTPSPDDPARLAETYVTIPEPQRLIHWGKMPSNTVLLTFDDGPDPTYTPEVLDILKQENVPATFFLIGGMVGANDDLVRRMVDEGHTIGSHSYTHPDFSQLTPLRLRLELALSQMMLKHVTGRETYLMRLPYATGSGPYDGNLSDPIREVTDRGYILALEDISPRDWAQLDADKIVSQVVSATQSGEGKVLVLHDGGGPRGNVVEALPKLIHELRARGYTFIDTPEVIGVPQANLMPPVTEKESFAVLVLVTVLSQFSTVLRWSFWIVIMMGLTRSVLILIASYFDRYRNKHTINEDHPDIDVLIPAYCEETVVAATVHSVLASNYPNLHVIVIDDGSPDRTFEVLLDQFGDHPGVTVLHKPNGGKSSALNYALKYSQAEIFVAIDADTLIEPRAISRLVRHFANPRVGAVAGNVKVGNRVNMLTRFQALEYITTQNIDRRAMELINGILVVPGAIGAWRRRAVEAAGSYQTDTLAEDADLTVSVNRAGYLTVFEPDAVAITEAPETLRQFFRQRLRWSVGMMQMAWKHRGAVYERGGLGLLALPDLVLFGVIMPLLAPLADLVFVMSVSGWIWSLIPGMHTVSQTPLSPTEIGAYLVLPVLDLFIALLAFRLEPAERKSLVFLVLINRFWYRQMLYTATIRAIRQVVMGRIKGWQKVDRTSALVRHTPPGQKPSGSVRNRSAISMPPIAASHTVEHKLAAE